MALTVESIVSVSEDQVHTTVGGEAVILGLRDGMYYGLDEVGATVWAILATPTRVSAVVAGVVAEFDVEQETAERDVLALLEELRARALIRVEERNGSR
ncbi:MAG: PqqD family protein [Gemmatimonadaceae bacterium]|nr:PqqD family protein [Gemmatimonadaceae bacterium]